MDADSISYSSFHLKIPKGSLRISVTEKVVRGLSPEDTESGRTRAEEIQDQRQRVLNIPLMGGEEGQGLLPGSLETWTSHRCPWK